MNRTLILFLALLLASTNLLPVRTLGQNRSSDRAIRKNESPISGQYIVVLKDYVERAQVASVAAGMARDHGRLLHVYDTAVKGFSVQMNENAAQALLNNPFVDYIEEDAEVFAAAVQAEAAWGLDRVDQRDLPLNSTYSYSNSGAGVNAYIIDSGILTSHHEFSGRASVAYDAVGDGQNGKDCYGHGTHVAAVIGGSKYGIAKSVNLRAVRVLDCFGRGSLSTVIAGVDWVSANHVKPAVANLSFISTAASDTLDAAVRNLISVGVTCVVSAGNNNIDAGTRSPARVAEAITVAATDSSDMKAVFSNYGSVVDLFAPGVDITSAWVTDDASTNLRSGTSTAAAFVTGIAAHYLSGKPTASPASVSQAIIDNATVGKVLNIDLSTQNRLLSVLPQSVSNVALQASVVASSENAGTQQTAVKAIDGVVDGYLGYPGDHTKEWATSLGGPGSWLKLTWSVPQQVNRIVLFDRPNLIDYIKSGTIFFSDGSSLPVGALNNNGAAKEVVFPTKTITGLTFRIDSCDYHNIGLAEIEVFGAPVYIPNESLNVALRSSATASSENADTQQTAVKAIDGVVDGYLGYPGDHTKEWATSLGGPGSWLKLTWSVPQQVNRIVLFDRPNLIDYVKSATILFSDGSSLSVKALNNDGTAKEITFPTKTITGLTFRIDSCDYHNIGLAEIQVFGAPVYVVLV